MIIPDEYKYLLDIYGPWYINEKKYACFVNNDKLVHRIILEEKFQGPIASMQVVHHIDGNKLNNRTRNLYVCSWDFHNFLHQLNIPKYTFWKKINSIKDLYFILNNNIAP